MAAVQVEISANIKGLNDALKEASVAMRDLAAKMKSSLEGSGSPSTALKALGASAKEAEEKLRSSSKGSGEATKGLEQKMKELKGELQSGDRLINYFANSLNGIVPEASAAGLGIRTLADAIVGGVGLGFAIQVGMTAIQLLGEKMTEAREKAIGLARDGIDSVTEAAGRAESAINKSFSAASKGRGPLGSNVARASLPGMERDLAAAQAAIAAEKAKWWTDEKKIAELEKRADELQRRIIDIRLSLPGAEASEAASAPKRKMIGPSVEGFNPDAKKDEDKRKAEEAKRKWAEEARQGRAEMDKANRSVLDDAQRELAVRKSMKVMSAAAEADYWSSVLQEINARGPEYVAAARDVEQRVADARARVKDQELAEFTRRFNAEVAAYEQKAAKEDELLQRQAQTYQQWGQTVGSALGQAFTGAISPLQALKSILSEVAQAVIKSAITSITASAAKAGGEAAASQAGIPVAGPALAAGALAATQGMVLALIASLPSAAGGWDLPAFSGGQLMVGHGREMMLPQEHADTIRSMKGTRAGGDTYNLNVSALDARGARRALEGTADELARIQRRRARRGGA